MSDSYARLLELLGVSRFVAAHQGGTRFVIDDPDVQRILLLTRECRPKVEAVLGISLRRITTDIGLLRRILAAGGVQLRSKRFGARQQWGLYIVPTLTPARP